ncbi:Asp/Glu/hydantoin racemase [Bacillus salipaludis]|uniref:Asp/Glu/hydantoin racemase n=1 Tax=Bacillus salipaludis TaxID=2547811 RepID=A0A4R5VL21_9BACI|nr:aspartate/glutamate racemase family protein [Bacillus salipaludis]MDQ6596613.1 aspartate/glutamate racemase family protein [Bacillus salipaludis]TDK58471.1 Asp/Glu/hydantoin racemase [Bacillus salipaludis]
MRILVINPNISESVTELIANESRRVASPGTELTFATASFGVAYIETRMEALIGGYAAACIAAERHGEYDGVIIDAFGDPGLLGIKEMLDVPVVGMTEAALASACLLGKRFSIIAISSRIKAWYLETVHSGHLTTRLASIRSLDDPLRDIGSVQEDHSKRLKELAKEAVEKDGADVIILAGAPLAGLARTLEGQLSVPVVDGVSSAVRHCESLIALNPGRAVAGSFAKPPIKPNKGLPPALAAILDRTC